MTCVVALAKQGQVYVGADSAGVSGLELEARADEKVFNLGPFLIGFAGSYRLGQLLRYAFAPPSHPEGVPNDLYMVTMFVNEVRKCLREGGQAKVTNEQEDAGGSFIVGYHGGLYVVHSDYQVARPRTDWAAVGSGAQVAQGALWALDWAFSQKKDATADEPDPRQVLELALCAAESYNAGVRGPFVILQGGAA
ncbi:MAG: hypothetical protein M1389_05005 [Chloroflexi bacterium]|nr:hypothetical protein [Chloroflexota bacterium]